MVFLTILGLAIIAGSSFYFGMGFGEWKERREWENRLILPPPPDENLPPELPEHAGEDGPYRTPELPVLLPPPKSRGLFGDMPNLGLSDIFKHFRHYGAPMEIYFANNSEMLWEIDFALVLNELEKYLRVRNVYNEEADEMQRLFLSLVHERNYQPDADIISARLNKDGDSYSMHLTLVCALGGIWPPSSNTLRQINQQKRYGFDEAGSNKRAEKDIRSLADEIFLGWKKRDEVAVTLAMCE